MLPAMVASRNAAAFVAARIDQVPAASMEVCPHLADQATAILVAITQDASSGCPYWLLVDDFFVLSAEYQVDFVIHDVPGVGEPLHTGQAGIQLHVRWTSGGDRAWGHWEPKLPHKAALARTDQDSDTSASSTGRCPRQASSEKNALCFSAAQHLPCPCRAAEDRSTMDRETTTGTPESQSPPRNLGGDSPACAEVSCLAGFSALWSPCAGDSSSTWSLLQTAVAGAPKAQGKARVSLTVRLEQEQDISDVAARFQKQLRRELGDLVASRVKVVDVAAAIPSFDVDNGKLVRVLVVVHPPRTNSRSDVASSKVTEFLWKQQHRLLSQGLPA